MLLLNQLAKKESCWKKALLFLLSKVRHLHPPGKKKLVYLNHWLCASMYVCIYLSMCTCMEIGSWCWMSSSVILQFSFWDLGFNKPGVFCSSWSLSPWDLPVSMPPAMGCRCMLPSLAGLPVSMPPVTGCRRMLPSPAFTWVLGIWNQVTSMLVHQTLDPLSHLSRI